LKQRRIAEQLEAEKNCRSDRGREELQNRQRKRRIAEQLEADQIYRTEKKW
jgi:hypothetical protein